MAMLSMTSPVAIVPDFGIYSGFRLGVHMQSRVRLLSIMYTICIYTYVWVKGSPVLLSPEYSLVIANRTMA